MYRTEFIKNISPLMLPGKWSNKRFTDKFQKDWNQIRMLENIN